MLLSIIFTGAPAPEAPVVLTPLVTLEVPMHSSFPIYSDHKYTQLHMIMVFTM